MYMCSICGSNFDDADCVNHNQQAIDIGVDVGYDNASVYIINDIVIIYITVKFLYCIEIPYTYVAG